MAKIITKVIVWHDERSKPDVCKGNRRDVEDFLFDYGFRQEEVRKIMAAPLWNDTHIGACTIQVQQVS